MNDPPGDGGAFGYWTDDPPAFHLNADPPRRDVWHQIGNDRLTATAHLAGHVTIYATDAGTVRLSSPRPQDRSVQGGQWAWFDRAGRTIVAAGDQRIRATWEVGAATWTAAGPGWELTRRVWVPFGHERAVRVAVAVRAADADLRGGTFVERWGFWPIPLVIGGLMAPLTPAPAGYPTGQRLGWLGAFAAAQVSRTSILTARTLLGRSLRLRVQADGDAGAGMVVLSTTHRPEWLRKARPSRRAAIPGCIVVAALKTAEAEIRTVPAPAPPGAPGTAVLLRSPLPERERICVSAVVGLVQSGTQPGDWVARQARQPTTPGGGWPGVFRLTLDPQPALARELRWHAGMLRSAQVEEPVFRAAYPAQGSAYGFVHGLQGAVRDYAFFLPPLCLADPAGARSLLLTMLALQHRDGSLAYAHTGAGHRTAALIHKHATDLPICLLWAATEYVWMTGDTAVLTERPPWHPDERGRPKPVTVAQRLLLAWRFLRDSVGLGSHGLIRIGSGDWNDPIATMAANRRAFRRFGESGYNSAFAAYVLPRAARLLADAAPQTALEMQEYADELRLSLSRAWWGSWFLRGWDGSGDPIGADRLFLDSNAWCLVAQVGTAAQRRTLIREIAARLDDPSPIGATSLDRPIAVRGGILAPGWDTNGGVWPALNALLVWGYALHEPDRALTLLHRTTMAAHARAYPGQWAGVWSGPDSYNAFHAADPGGTFVQPATPMTEFPVMNANAHAGPLLALLKVLGLESGPDGLAVRRVGPVRDWQLHTPLGTFGAEATAPAPPAPARPAG